ncbi:MAG: hypothetical protein WD847_02280 [Pirellulales bacterium]
MSDEERPNRSIVYEERFDRELEQIEPDFVQADECLRGLEWAFVRRPELGYQSSQDSKVWYFPLVRDDFPPVCVFYTFDDKSLCFLSIRLMPGNGSDHLD